MHDTALKIGRLAIEIYADKRKPHILEIGSLDVNGSLRQFAPADGTYIGVDMCEGQSVDVVVEPGQALPFDPGSFDLVLASSVFEHDPAFWMTFLELVKVMRKGGFLYINAPSNGKVHRYPEDHWRFYPDAGRALERWAKNQGHDVTLIESFTAPRIGDMWNDFVAVFQKEGGNISLPSDRLNSHVEGTNVWLRGEAQPKNVHDATEDMELLAGANRDIHGLRQTLAEAQSLASKNVSDLEARLAILQSTLLQREEEIAQTRRDLDAALIQARTDSEQTVALRARLDQTDSWVFEMAGRARQAEIESTREARRAREAEASLRSAEVTVSGLKDQVNELRKNVRALEAKNSQIPSLKDNVVRLERNVRELETKNLEISASLSQSKASVANRFEEVATLTALLKESETTVDTFSQQREWLANVVMTYANRPAWWGLMPKNWVRRRLHERLLRKSLFNAEAYLALYPDVAGSEIDPVDHYVLHGMGEGRTLVR